MLKIHLPKGFHSIIGEIRENEILLSYDTKLKIDSKKYHINENEEGEEFKVYDVFLN
jgi:hypothetical protein